MRKILPSLLLFLALAAYGQQTSIAVLPSEGATLGNDELEALTDKTREAALKVLPTNTFVLLKQDVVVKRLGGMENYIKKCVESSCIVDLGRQAQVDYVAQASVRKLDGKIRLKVELYSVSTEGLVGMVNDEAENARGLLAIVEKRVPAEVFGKIPGASGGSRVVSTTVAGGISGLEKTVDYELDERFYLANLSTEPPGAVLSFDGVPAASCPKTPCKAELHEGSVRIIAALEQYETADTTVSIKQNNQSIEIRLKPNFGILEIKPAYQDGIGKDTQWSLAINDKSYSLGEIRLSPNRYAVRLSHECYENIGFDAGINKGSREVFDMAGNIKLKKGGLVLRAERSGEPVSQPVFVNGKRVGETPFSGAVPVCAKVEIGESREKVEVRLKHNDKVTHTVKSIGGVSGGYLADSRDGKRYKVAKIGNQTWMAENLNYNASGSRCYDNQESYCQKYGRLYDWNTAKTACPRGWHLPSDAEWTKLTDFVGGLSTAGTRLKAAGGWNGEDKFGFSALPGGYGYSGGSFGSVGYHGYWWSASKYGSSSAYNRYMGFNLEYVGYSNYGKSSLFSVRCLQD